MIKKEMNSKDLLLSFLFAPGVGSDENEPIIGRTRLTKMMFLFEEQLYKDFFKDEININLPVFEPYYFGPFSKQMIEDLSFFQSIGMIDAQETNIPISNAEKLEFEEVFDNTDEWEETSFDDEEKFELSYSLSKAGEKYVQDNVWIHFTKVQKEKLIEFKKQINLISLDALLRYVYNKYPDTTKNSIIANKYLERG